MAKSRKSIFIVLFIIPPLIVIGVQYYLSTYKGLSKWKGGGFAMYNSPHPNSSRTIWISGINDEDTINIRIHPKLESVNEFFSDYRFNPHLDRIHKVCMEDKNFPLLVDSEEVESSLKTLLTLDILNNSNGNLLDYRWELIFLELYIHEDFNKMVYKELSRIKLELKGNG